MSASIEIDSKIYKIPQKGDVRWGKEMSLLLEALFVGALGKLSLDKTEHLTGGKIFTQSPHVPSPKEMGDCIRKSDVDDLNQRISNLETSIFLSDDLFLKVVKKDVIADMEGDVDIGENRFTNLVEDSVENDIVRLGDIRTKENEIAKKLKEWTPKGSMIFLHPLAPEPDKRFWKLCDGKSLLPEDFLKKDGISNVEGDLYLRVPDFTDGVFLMGDDSSLIDPHMGGGNYKFLEIKNLPHHVHGFKHGHSSHSLQAVASGAHSHSLEISNRTKPGRIPTPDPVILKRQRNPQNFQSWTAWDYDRIPGGRYGNVLHNHQILGEMISQGNTQGIALERLNEPFDNRPRYFTTKIYLKVA